MMRLLLCTRTADRSIFPTDRLLATCVGCCLIIVGTSTALADAPTLEGLDTNKPIVVPFKVQAAYNDDTMFFNIEWDGDRGDTHDLVRFNGTEWQREGGPRRDAQATIDNDPSRGPTNLTSTNYESRVTWMINDPNGPNAVPNFAATGCFCTCHDNSRAMPEWDPNVNLTKYLNEDFQNPGAKLDLWHHRQSRANPIGMSDDQIVVQTDGSVGGRGGDQGVGAPYESNSIVDGKPKWVLDNTTSEGGAYAFPFEDVHTDPNHDFMRAGDTPPVSVATALDYQDALDRGYVPQLNDTVPFRRLRDLRETPRGDITADGTTFTPTDAEEHFGHIESSTQRLLDTGDPDDTALAEGGVYDIAFGLHTGMVTVRDHYVSFPMKLSLGGGEADLEAVKIEGQGRDVLPNWTEIEESVFELFLPGIASLEFLLNENIGKEYFDPANDNLPVDQVHGGAAGLASGMTCAACHGVSGAEGLSMEALVPQRGGVWTVTPLVPEPDALIIFLVTVGGCSGLFLNRRRRRP